jgi:predicted MFS family arabinose efflux permease
MSSANTAKQVRPARQPTGTTAVSRLFLPLIALCSAVTAANIYLAAPLLSVIAEDFGTTPSAVAWIASVAQFGYAAGLLFFAPLGDRVSRRPLVAVLSLATTAALAVGAAASGTTALAAAVLVASAATVVPQLLVPLVAERAPADRRARHVAAVIAGLFTGIVAARVLGGLAGQAFGWRWVFVGAAVLTAALGLLTAAVLPAERPRRTGGPGGAGEAGGAGGAGGRDGLDGLDGSSGSEGSDGPSRPGRTGRPGPPASLVSGLAAMPGLVRRSPDLWRACVRQAGMYGAWSALWTTLTLLLTGEPYALSTATAGLFGLFGLAASVVAPLAGGLVDRFGATRVVRSAYVLAAVSVPLFWLGGRVMVALFVGAVAIHAALVASHVANQTLALTTTASPAKPVTT